MNNVTRRSVLMGAGAFSAAAVVAGPVLALTEAGARKLVDKLVGDINRVIASGKSENAMYGDFERIFATYADVPTIAAYALGVDGRSASASQMKAFTTAFQGYISRKYGKRFREFIGGKIEVKSVGKEKSYYAVRSTVYLKGEAPFALDFLVSDRSGRDKFFNMKFEGINLLLTERTEIGSMLDRRKGNLDQLISDLKRAG